MQWHSIDVAKQYTNPYECCFSFASLIARRNVSINANNRAIYLSNRAKKRYIHIEVYVEKSVFIGNKKI